MDHKTTCSDANTFQILKKPNVSVEVEVSAEDGNISR